MSPLPVMCNSSSFPYMSHYNNWKERTQRNQPERSSRLGREWQGEQVAEEDRVHSSL